MVRESASERARSGLVKIWGGFEPWNKENPPSKEHLQAVQEKIHESLKHLITVPIYLLYSVLYEPSKEGENGPELRELLAQEHHCIMPENGEATKQPLSKILSAHLHDAEKNGGRESTVQLSLHLLRRKKEFDEHLDEKGGN